MKETCIYWSPQADGVQGDCLHPENPGGQCVLGYADDCTLKEEPETVHTCVVCGNTMSYKAYKAKGCIFCGADAEPLFCPESYEVRDRE